MVKDNVGFDYDIQNDHKEWDNVVKIAFDKDVSEEVRHQAFTLLRIRKIVQDGIDANGIFSGIKWDNETGKIVESESAIENTSIGVDNILGGHSGRIYLSMPINSEVDKVRDSWSAYGKSLIKSDKSDKEKYSDLLLDIVVNTKNAKNKYSNLSNAKDQTGWILGTLVSIMSSRIQDDIVINGLYSRLAATHGVKEVEERASEIRVTPMTEAINVGSKVALLKASRHFGIDFVSYDENNELVSDGNRGHMYINSAYTKQYSAFGIGLEGFAPSKGSHDTSGNSDLYSAFGGPKYYIKVKKGDVNFEEYIKKYCMHVCGDIDENNLEKTITQVKKEIFEVQNKSADEVDKLLTGKDFEHFAVEVTDKEKINIVKSKDDSTYYIVSELARKKLIEGNTLPKYIDGMRIIIAKDEECVQKYEDNEGKGNEFLTNIETRRNEVDTYKATEDLVIKNFDKDKDEFGLKGVNGLNEENLKKFLQEVLCSKENDVKKLIEEVSKKINQVEKVNKMPSVNNDNNTERLFSTETKGSFTDKYANQSKGEDNVRGRK